MTLTERPNVRVRESLADTWPAEVSLIISAMDAAGPQRGAERRTLPRLPYRVKARLRLFSDEHGTPPWSLYTCDINERGLGFVSPHRLPVSHGGILEIVAPNNKLMSVHCTLYRCSEVSRGWYRGSLFFNREQPAFRSECRMD